MTLREHLEATRARHHAHDYFDVYDKPLLDVGCAACPFPHTWPCPDRTAAVAALAILDAAERERNDSRDPSNRYPLDRVLIDDPPVSS